MGILELFIIGVGLSMDAFAVSICKGLSVRTLRPRHALITGAYFGGFQALMPLLGFVLGVRFQSLITSVDHWIAFVLLALIGGNMVRESRETDEESLSDSFSFTTMLPLAVATSIAGHRRDLCVFAGGHHPRRLPDRRDDLCAVLRGRQGG